MAVQDERETLCQAQTWNWRVSQTKQKRAETLEGRLTMQSRRALKEPLHSRAETVMWLNTGSMASVRWEKVQRENGGIQWKRKVAYPVRKIDDYVKDIFREQGSVQALNGG